MRINLKLLIFLLLLPALSSLAQVEIQVAGIRKIYQETNEKVAECEANGEYSSVFLSEVTVNKNNGSYPAVGIYRSVIKFYYTYGDREKNPYPNRLLKIMVTTNRSSQTENSEFLFNPNGQLIFYFEKKDEVERRLYFAAEKLIKALEGEKIVKINTPTELERVKSMLQEKRRLSEAFTKTLDN